MIYNASTFCLVITLETGIYCAILGPIQSLSSASSVNFVQIGLVSKRRKIKSVQFHPVNPQLLVVLYNCSVIEVYDLASNIEDSFLYLNYGHLNTREIDRIRFITNQDKVIKYPEQLPMFFLMSDGSIWSSGALLYPKVYLDNRLFDILDEEADLNEPINIELFDSINQLKDRLKDNMKNHINLNIEGLMEFNFRNSKDFIELSQKSTFKASKTHEFFVFRSDTGGIFIFTIITNEAKSNVAQHVLDIYLCYYPFTIVPLKDISYDIYQVFAISILIEKNSIVTAKRKGHSVKVLTARKFFNFDLEFLVDIDFSISNLKYRDDIEKKVNDCIGCVKLKPISYFKDFYMMSEDKIMALSDNQIFIINTTIKKGIKDIEQEKQNINKDDIEIIVIDTIKPLTCPPRKENIDKDNIKLQKLLVTVVNNADALFKTKNIDITLLDRLINDVQLLLTQSQIYRDEVKLSTVKYVDFAIEIKKFILHLTVLRNELQELIINNKQKLNEIKAKDSQLTKRVETIYNKMLVLKADNEKGNFYEIELKNLPENEVILKTRVENDIYEVC